MTFSFKQIWHFRYISVVKFQSNLSWCGLYLLCLALFTLKMFPPLWLLKNSRSLLLTFSFPCPSLPLCSWNSYYRDMGSSTPSLRSMLFFLNLRLIDLQWSASTFLFSSASLSPTILQSELLTSTFSLQLHSFCNSAPPWIPCSHVISLLVSVSYAHFLVIVRIFTVLIVSS